MKIGDRVLTVKPEQESTDWTSDAKKGRQWGVYGTIIDRSDSHGETFQVRYDTCYTGWFEARELKLCSEILSEEILQHEQLAIKLAYLTTTIGQKEKEYQREYAELRKQQDELEKALKDHRETLKKLAGRV